MERIHSFSAAGTRLRLARTPLAAAAVACLFAAAPFALSARSWRLQGEHDAAIRDALRLGWGLGSYRFSRYKTPSRAPALLHTDAAADDEV
ncbi:hypothetical protein AB4084_18005, partial [Lysobacter sp. 2RAB21]